MILASLRCSSRHFATASATKRGPKVEPSRLPNGLSVASVELQGPISQLMFAFRSGARFEQHDEAGLTHQLRNAIGTDSTNNGQYTDNLNIAAPGVVTQHVCKASNLNQFQLSQINSLHPDTGVVGVYLSTEGTKVLPFVKAAAQGLREMASKPISDELLQACKLLAKGTALTPDEFIALLKTVTADDVKKAASPTLRQSPYLAGEVHQAGPTDLAHVALVGHGAKLTDEKAVAIQAVLCAAIGQTGQYTDNLNMAAPGVVSQHVFNTLNHQSVRLFSTTHTVDLMDFPVLEERVERVRNELKVEAAEKVAEIVKVNAGVVKEAATFANSTQRSVYTGVTAVVGISLTLFGVLLSLLWGLFGRVGSVEANLSALKVDVDARFEKLTDSVDRRFDRMERGINRLLTKNGSGGIDE